MILTNHELGSTRGMFIGVQHLNARRSAAIGTVVSQVPGHAGDVWWVEHDGVYYMAPYCFDEFEPLLPVEPFADKPIKIDSQLRALLEPFAQLVIREDAKPDDYALDDQKVRVKDIKRLRQLLDNA